MADDNRPEIILDGDISPFRQKMREAAKQLQQFGSEGEQAVGRMTGPLNALQEKFLAIGAILAGGAVFKEAVAQTAAWANESVDLAAALDMSAASASDLKAALASENVSVDEFVSAGQKLSAVLRTNEEALNQVGLVTRDAAGNLRPLNDLTLDAIGLLDQYKAGTDRAVASDILFGRGFKINGDLAKVNSALVADYAEKQRRLGMVMTEENVAAFEAYDQSGKDSEQTMRALMHTIGNAIIPILTSLRNSFNDAGPYLVRFARMVMETFLGIVDLAMLVKQSFVSVGTDIGAVAAAAGRALSGDFSGAMNVFKARAREAAEDTKKLKDLWNGTGDSFLGKYRAKVNPANIQDAPPSKPEGKSASGLVKDGSKGGADKSHMSEYEAQLLALKNKYEQENLLRQFSKEQELAYWRELLKSHEVSSGDRLAITKRTATLELDIRRQSAKEQRDLDAVTAESRRAAALYQIQIEEQQATFARENGAITQRELIAQQEEFARRRFEIEYQSLMQRLEMASNDPNSSPAELAKVKEQMLEIERQYHLRRSELQQQVVVESTATWRSFSDTIAGLWDKGIQALMNGTLTWRNAFRAVGAELTRWFAVEVVGKQVKEWIAGQAKMLAVKLGFMQAEKAVQAATSKEITLEKGKEAISVIASNAAEAGSGAAAAVAPTPFVGPMLAIASMAAVFGAVMALGSRKSAAGGYDIPRGLNPLVQTHEEEMILPAKYANVIRGMAEGQGEGGQGGGSVVHNHYNVQAWDSRDVGRFLRDNARHVAAATKSAHRDGFV